MPKVTIASLQEEIKSKDEEIKHLKVQLVALTDKTASLAESLATVIKQNSDMIQGIWQNENKKIMEEALKSHIEQKENEENSKV